MAAGDGLISMTPTSIAYSGTSASINADGGVDFSAVTSLSLNGVFTSDIDNYLIVVEAACSGNDTIYYRLRASGADNSTSSAYVTQVLYAGSTTVSGARDTQNYGSLGYFSSTTRNGFSAAIYAPFIAQPTAVRSVGVSGYVSAYVDDRASTHNQSTAYDGITIYPGSTNITGSVHVLGYEE